MVSDADIQVLRDELARTNARIDELAQRLDKHFEELDKRDQSNWRHIEIIYQFVDIFRRDFDQVFERIENIEMSVFPKGVFLRFTRHTEDAIAKTKEGRLLDTRIRLPPDEPTQ
jgi:hypothetical protein